MSNSSSGMNLDKIIVFTNNTIILLSILFGQVFGVASSFLTWVAIVSAAIMLIGCFTKVVPLSLVLSGMGVKSGSVFKDTGSKEW